MIKFSLIVCLLLFQGITIPAQQLNMLSLGNPASLRGLCAVNNRVIWVSGSSGTVGISLDAGLSWKWITVLHYEKTDFRDVEAFSEQEAVIMGITQPAVILKTINGGKTWIPVFQDTSRAMFLDAMDFSGDAGILLGDPVDNKIFLAQSNDRGDSWKIIAGKNQQVSTSGEAFFAASGTNIKWLPDNHYTFVSGGKKSALYFDSSGKFPLQLSQGKESTGANSIAINPTNPNQAFITGGDFSKDRTITGNAMIIYLHPFHQQVPHTAPHGYRSCVEYINKNTLICCGTSGVDISEDGGMNWKLISTKSFHVCRKAKSGNRIFLAGAKGAIAYFVW
jgi:photosystem II stability/assembly factor-like uncharacterized protein